MILIPKCPLLSTLLSVWSKNAPTGRYIFFMKTWLLHKRATQQSSLLGEMSFMQNHCLPSLLKVKKCLPIAFPAEIRCYSCRADFLLAVTSERITPNSQTTVHLQRARRWKASLMFQVAGDLRWRWKDSSRDVWNATAESSGSLSGSRDILALEFRFTWFHAHKLCCGYTKGHISEPFWGGHTNLDWRFIFSPFWWSFFKDFFRLSLIISWLTFCFLFTREKLVIKKELIGCGLRTQLLKFFKTLKNVTQMLIFLSSLYKWSK